MPEATNEEKAQAILSKPALRAALRWYLVGFTLLGASVGYFAGSSESPVIGALLPLLFGLVGGAGGLYLAKTDLTTSESWFRIRMIGKALTLFLVFALLGSAYGISLRTGRGLGNFVPSGVFAAEDGVPLPPVDPADPDRAVRFALLRARLAALGASKDEQRSILARVAGSTERVKSDEDIIAVFHRLVTRIGQARSLLRTALEEGDESRRTERVPDLCEYFRLYIDDFNQCVENVQDDEEITVAFVCYRIDGLQEILGKYTDPTAYDSCALWLAGHDEARRAIFALEWALIEEKRKLGRPDWIDGGPLIQEIDGFLGIFYGSSGGGEASVPWELPRLSHEN